MQHPEYFHETRGDHDYVGPNIADDEESSNDVFEPVRRLRSRSRRVPTRRVGNTDHDYLATAQSAGDETDQVDGEGDGDGDIDGDGEDTGATVATQTEQNILLADAENATLETANSPNNNASTSAAAAAAAAESTGASAPIAIDLRSPSPPKKRKRRSNGTPKVSTPKVKSSANGADGDNDDDDDDDGLICPICLDTWEMSGKHRLVSLRCGHLFGESCIRRWLTECTKQSGMKVCPQCKVKTSSRDIRCLYAKRLRAIDRTEEYRLREELETERRRNQTLQTEFVTLRTTHLMVSNKISVLEADNERMRKLLSTRDGDGGGVDELNYEVEYGKTMQQLPLYKLFMERNIEIAREPGCRTIVHSEHQSALIASQKSTQNLFPGYGLRFIDTHTLRPLNFIHASCKLVRDMALSSNQQTLAVASMETRAKLFDLRTRQIAAVFSQSERALWSCAMDRNEREHFVYLGAQHGSTYIYDVRFPETIVEEFKTEDLSPVINVAAVPANEIFPNGGFIVCKLQSLWFYEYCSLNGSAIPTRINVVGPFISMNYDVAQETLLISARNSASYPQSRYMFGKLEKCADRPVFNVKVSFFGSKTTPVMTRCTQIAIESNTLIAGYIQDVKLLALFDARRQQRLQSLPVQDVVYDTCPLYMGNATYLAALTETKCRIYKLTPTTTTSS